MSDWSKWRACDKELTLHPCVGMLNWFVLRMALEERSKNDPQVKGSSSGENTVLSMFRGD